MAKSDRDGQLAQCIEVSSYTGSDGKDRETFIMRLDGNESKDFELLSSKYFKAVKGKYYFPVVDVVLVAKVSPRTNRPYNRATVVVHWHEAG